ncbi:hypothetical protein AHYW_002608 [Providencia manganoxydans]|uniref:GPW/gp25 family protein n=1 Tax=Providencia manganoxydans TaxID=2923283 RepID=UPI003D9FB337
MTTLIGGIPLSGIQIGATGLDEIYQNVRTILATTRGSVFLDRHFGIDSSLLDQPTPAALSRYRAHVVTEIEKQEPRVKVVSVSFEQTTEKTGKGELRPVVSIQIKPGVLL